MVRTSVAATLAVVALLHGFPTGETFRAPGPRGVAPRARFQSARAAFADAAWDEEFAGPFGSWADVRKDYGADRKSTRLNSSH